MSQLNSKQTEKIKLHCARAYEVYDSGDFSGALRLFYQAWLLVPKPQTDYQESGWILTGIGDTYFQLGKYPQACEALNSALHCPGTDNNPFILMRIGQAHYDHQEKPLARKFLLKAYRQGGTEIFKKESKVYLEAIRDLI